MLARQTELLDVITQLKNTLAHTQILGALTEQRSGALRKWKTEAGGINSCFSQRKQIFTLAG